MHAAPHPASPTMNVPPSQEPLADVPPWEDPGAVRRDSISDRAAFLVRLGHCAYLVSNVSLLLFLPALVALPLSLVVCWLAVSDLRDMRAGTMDRAGQDGTEEALRDGCGAALLSFAVLVIGTLLYLRLVW